MTEGRAMQGAIAEGSTPSLGTISWLIFERLSYLGARSSIPSACTTALHVFTPLTLRAKSASLPITIPKSSSEWIPKWN
jgi:hypothetical protein